MLWRPQDPVPPLERVLLNGSSGSGKSHVGRQLERTVAAAYVELDGLHHGPGWTPRETFLDEAEELAAQEYWITDWQYTRKVGDLFADRATAVVWVDPHRARHLTQVVRRTLRRRRRREVLWNGNLEPPLHTFFTDDDHVVRWAWQTRHEAAQRVERLLLTRPEVPVVRLRNRAQVDSWIRRVRESQS